MSQSLGHLIFRGENEIACAHILWIAADGVDKAIHLLLNVRLVFQHNFRKSNP